MAGDWIKMQTTTPDKPEVWRIAEILDIDPDAAFGKLFRVWCWFDQQTDDGVAPRAAIRMLDRITGINGFCDAVKDSGWLAITDDHISMVNFDSHNSASAKKRAQTARRVANHKKRKGNVEGNAEGNERTSLPRPIRRKVFERDNHTCVYCGRKEGEYGPGETSRDGVISIDHVVPITSNGNDDIGNLVTSCVPCNIFKNNRTPDECGLEWPVDSSGERYGSVSSALPREEKRREESKQKTPTESKTRGTRFKKGSDLPESWAAFCQSERPDLVPEKIFSQFHDYWIAQPGQKGVKTDWDATRRNWVRRQDAQKPKLDSRTTYDRLKESLL